MPKGKAKQHTHQSSLSPTQIPQYLAQPQQYGNEAYAQQAAFQQQQYYQSRTAASLNLTVLQRHNPHITEIVSIANFAVVYTFAQATGPDQQPGWEKTGVEGTLFVVALDYQDGFERYGILVLNRKGLDNFEVELHKAEDIEVSGEFVILQNQDDAEGMGITGLWIFASSGEDGQQDGTTQEPNVRDVVAAAMSEYAGRAEASQARNQQQSTQQMFTPGYGMGFDGAADTGGNADVLQSLFARARSAQTGY